MISGLVRAVWRLELAVGRNPDRMRSVYVRAARATGRPLTRAVAPHPAPSRHARRIGHWVRSLPGIYDMPALVELDVPWWTYGAIDAVESWLASRSGARVFEFGSGASTVWLAGRAGEVRSVEHDAGFAAQVGSFLTNVANVTLDVVPAEPSQAPRAASGKVGFEDLDFSDYVAAIDQFSERFDLIVIDGRARVACLAAAARNLADDGLIVFDNSRRGRYRAAIESCGLPEKRFRGLAPTLPYPEQTSLLAAGRPEV